MKTILITGASRGIGLAAARAFAEAGYALFINSRSREKLAALSRELCETYRVPCVPVPFDAGIYSEVEAAFRDIILPRAGQLDVLVNNAGVSYFGLLQDMEEADWDRVLNANLKSVFNCCKFALRPMLAAKSGSIINVSSVWGVSGASMETAYSASKGGMNALTRALAREVAPSGIRVNAIACGVIDTAMNAPLSAEDRSALADSIGMGRFGRPEEVANLILYLAGDGASYLTGQVIPLDGSFI